MKINIAVPTGKMYDVLLENSKEAAEKHNLNIIRADEQQCSKLMLNNRVSAALLTPSAYAAGMNKADYRVMPYTCLAAVNYTGLASIFFKQGLRTVKTMASPDSELFLIKIGKLILAERFEMIVELSNRKGSVEELLNESDSVAVIEKSEGNDQALDISEEWFNAHEMPLPLAVWTCRNEEAPDKIEEIIYALAGANLPAEIDVLEKRSGIDQVEPRDGKLMFKWNEEVKNSLDQILQFMFFHQLFDEMPGVKVYGEDLDLEDKSDSLELGTNPN